MDKQGKVDFVWRYQPSKNTADGLLMSYIKDSLFMLPKEMILYPLRAYWLALAYQEKGDIDPVLLERIFRKAVYALEKYALYLCDQAGIDYRGIFTGKHLFLEHFLYRKRMLVMKMVWMLIQILALLKMMD